MITLKTKIFNTFSKIDDVIYTNKQKKLKNLSILIHKYEDELNYEYIECPHCHSDKLIRYGSYKRNIGIFGEYFLINIKRVKCKECSHTHALIPSFMLPYYQNEVSFILLNISSVKLENNKISFVSNKSNITRQLLRFWIKRFDDHLSRLKTTFSYDLNKIISHLFEGIKTREIYFKKNMIYFLEKLPT